MQTEHNARLNQNETLLQIAELLEYGNNLLSIGQSSQAIQYYEKAAVQDPDNAAPYVGLGTAALKNENLDDAMLAFRVACRLDRNNSKAYEGIAAIASKKGNHEKAFEMYLKCLELDSDNLTALLGLFQASLQMGSFSKIIHYLEIYLNLHPDDTSVMFTLATLYVREDKLEAAKEKLLDILKLDANNKDASNLLEEIPNGTHRETE